VQSGEVVVIHDFDLKRVAGLDRRVETWTMKNSRRSMSQWTRVPLFEEVLQLCQNKVLYDIELKAEAVKNLAWSRKSLTCLQRPGCRNRPW
jgi:glycerophosphoryl diester phosphodiesterase